LLDSLDMSGAATEDAADVGVVGTNGPPFQGPPRLADRVVPGNRSDHSRPVVSDLPDSRQCAKLKCCAPRSHRTVEP
jgi:hypothetical protein